jgi:hypothetical protein
VEPDAAGGDVAAEVAMQACPFEVDLAGLLPCLCFDTVATDPAAQVPGCMSLVVCCPECHGLRCEDHKYYEVIDECSLLEDALDADPATPEPEPEVAEEEPTGPEVAEEVAIPEETAEEVKADVAADIGTDAPTPPVCPYEVDLSTHTPCTCKGVLVKDVKLAMPTCTKKVVCCPYDGLKCE